MERLDDLEALVAIVEKGSQAAAARYLRRSLQSLNRSLHTLERAVGVELVKRTTRRSEPTQAGLLFYRRIRPAIGQILDARLEAANSRSEVSGFLRVSAPVLFTSSYVAPIVCDFLELYPRVEIELRTSDEQVDLLAEGIDIAVRIGESADESLVARRLHALPVATFAAPSYLAAHGRPQHPNELRNHVCILRARAAVVDQWSYRIEGRLKDVKVRGRMHTNSATVIRIAAASGLGIARLPLWQIADLVENGALEIVLAPFESEGVPLQLVWPPTKAPLERTRRFVDFLAGRLRAALT